MADMDAAYVAEVRHGQVHSMALLNQQFGAAADQRQIGASFVHELMRHQYLAGRESVNFREGTGQRLVTESGSGRTRAETNAPVETSAAGGSTPG